MDLMDLLKASATLIKNNGDDATARLDVDNIANALKGLLTYGDGSLNLASFVSGLSQNGLGEIVGSWLGNGENKSISAEQVISLLGSDKISLFALQLGLSQESAASALADILPPVVDKATSGEGSIIDEMLGQRGGTGNAMDMLGKIFR